MAMFGTRKVRGAFCGGVFSDGDAVSHTMNSSDMIDASNAGEVETAARAGCPHDFIKSENGSMTVFTILFFVLGLVATGMALDFMRHEYMRVKLQNTLDTAILAAANLRQTQNPEAVVRDHFERAKLDNYKLDVEVDQGLNFKQVKGIARTKVGSMFLNMVGIDEMETPAAGMAEERRGKVEIAVVLDISSSMSVNGRIANMKAAARDFMDIVLTPDRRDLVSVNLVPYTGQTNPGQAVFDMMNVDARHNYSHCIEFDEEDFKTTEISFTKKYTHVPHFSYNKATTAEGVNKRSWCPVRENDTIKYFQNNPEMLKTVIKNYKPIHYTGIHYAMKWGVASLDPGMRPVINTMVANGTVPEGFEGRPALFGDTETMKFVVLMTDGENIDQIRVKDRFYDQEWIRNRLAVQGVKAFRWQNGRRGVGYYDHTIYRSSTADTRLQMVCDQAADAGIRVFTIGFELDKDHKKKVMKDCASSDADYFEVHGEEINNAFSSIAGLITQLRLGQ